MSKHTPGPWFVESSDKTPIYVSPVTRHEQIAICNVMVIDEDGDSDSGEWINGDQTKANAHLIAAAPELLAALEVIINDIVPIDPHNSMWVEGRAAIAKARGES